LKTICLKNWKKYSIQKRQCSDSGGYDYVSFSGMEVRVSPLKEDGCLEGMNLFHRQVPEKSQEEPRKQLEAMTVSL
jgi:hypothetical protein